MDLPEITTHIIKINDELGQVQNNIAVLQIQVSELIWWFRAFAVGFISLLVSQGWQIITMRRKREGS